MFGLGEAAAVMISSATSVIRMIRSTSYCSPTQLGV